jgi:flagellar biosynthetic protein FliR
MLLTDALVVFLLIFTRLGTVLLLVPLFGASNVPNQAKVLFTALLSLVFFSTGHYTLGIDSANFAHVGIGILFEIINGFTIGFVVVLIMNALYLAGHIIDMDMGFAMVNVISAQDDSEIPVTANFYYLIMMILFVITNSHHRIIEAFHQSLTIVPLGVIRFNPIHVNSYVALIKETFVIGFQIAMPIIATILVANIVLGMLSKAMPGMNVFMVGMPFKILIGLSTLLIVFPITVKMFGFLLERMLTYLQQILFFMR